MASGAVAVLLVVLNVFSTMISPAHGPTGTLRAFKHARVRNASNCTCVGGNLTTFPNPESARPDPAVDSDARVRLGLRIQGGGVDNIVISNPDSNSENVFLFPCAPLGPTKGAWCLRLGATRDTQSLVIPSSGATWMLRLLSIPMATKFQQVIFGAKTNWRYMCLNPQRYGSCCSLALILLHLSFCRGLLAC